ncbi:4-(cytidine 5'-diphospho)-2-C-methyl-D-erythritol kinase [Sphingomonas sp. BT-65]|uniref:4-(cytidine 5'-diphospho)-2-C-methyl-D-erythritol kinase n=1 Tax=Sphingomonas sp. BT-65 TaxID=2989821 RepID=UPI0022364649|nr:4-(cytidine 5'-diphospho)-2-C-methyl-D-erythritol kinase [Sphingomonas sp. BT-65]MCW4460329.1 4-(cytidine 5'-diphospho)-2-C-methyl-D-erythritol kinase [Sphingomonas sp. BT-65]
MLTEPAPAKLNLALHVRRRREDGYHELETLFAFVADGDAVTLGEGQGFAVNGPFAAALLGEDDNLVTRAAARFAQVFDLPVPGRITLTKRLPVASGLGGGSADAAATLRLLARHHGIALDDPRLFDCADALGSDVPACLYSRTAIGRGRGEQLVPVAGAPGTPVLLVNPGVAVSTAEVFRRWDGIDRGTLREGDLLAAARAGRNDLEPPALAIAPVIGEVLELLGAQPGATLARMSGSGATCFALFDSLAARTSATEAVRGAQPGWWCLETVLL